MALGDQLRHNNAQRGIGLAASRGQIEAIEKQSKALQEQSATMAGVFIKEIGHKLAPVQEKLMIIWGKFVDSVSPAIIKATDYVAQHFSSWASIVQRKVAPVISSLIHDGFQKLGELIKWYQANSAWLNPALVKLAGAWVALKVAMVVMPPIIAAVTAAQWLWNAAMLANPIGLTIAGIAAIGVAIGLLIWKWKEVTKAAAGFLGSIAVLCG